MYLLLGSRHFGWRTLNRTSRNIPHLQCSVEYVESRCRSEERCGGRCSRSSSISRGVPEAETKSVTRGKQSVGRRPPGDTSQLEPCAQTHRPLHRQHTKWPLVSLGTYSLYSHAALLISQTCIGNQYRSFLTQMCDTEGFWQASTPQRRPSSFRMVRIKPEQS